MIKELRKKFILINMLLVMIVLSVVFSIVCISAYRQALDESNAALNMAIGWRGEERPPSFHIGQAPPPNFTHDIVFAVSIDNSGAIRLFHAENVSLDESELTAIIQKIIDSGEMDGVLKDSNLRYLMRNMLGETKIAFVELSRQQSTIRNTVISSLISGVLALLAFFAISMFLSKWALRPVERSWQQQRQFLADASHELKTPLTVILANTNILKTNTDDPISKQLRWIDNTEEEATRMKKLVDDMLYLAKSDNTKLLIAHSDINLSDVITNAVLAFESVAFERNILLEYNNIDSAIHINGNADELKQLVGILLDNAVKFSPKKETVDISLKLRQGKAFLSVHNMGITIPDHELPHVFERFYRTDKSRSNEGYGLGLSIAKTIVDAHGGKISVESSQESGTVFRISFHNI